jgi:Glycosyl transferase family 11
VIVIARKVGRLANRIKLFAHFIGAAVEHGLVVYNPAFVTYAQLFPATARDLLCRFPPRRRLPPVPGARASVYRGTLGAADVLHRLQRSGRDVGLIRLTRDEHLDLNSDAFLDVVRRHRVVFVQDWWFRNHDNCLRHRDAIREYFTPWEHHLARSRAALEPARRRDRFVVGVHVRRGDYRRYRGGRFYYSDDQYREVMARAEAAFASRDVAFFVCSDAPLPPGAFAGIDVVYGNGHPLEDLYALAACDRLIGPPSTYSAWASYYGDVPRYEIFDPAHTPGEDSFLVDRGLGKPAHLPAPTTSPLESTSPSSQRASSRPPSNCCW